VVFVGDGSKKTQMLALKFYMDLIAFELNKGIPGIKLRGKSFQYQIFKNIYNILFRVQLWDRTGLYSSRKMVDGKV
jgi:hypothetical protein